MRTVGIYSSGWSAPGVVQFGASDFWRLAVPGRELARNGYRVIAGREIQAAKDGTLILKDEDDVLHDDCEVIVWQRWMGRDAVEAIKKAQSVGQAQINDVDDYYWAIPVSNVARDNTDPRRNANYNRDIYREVIQASTLVTVSTPYLAKALQRWGPPVRVVRNYIALDQWEPKPPGEFIGWVGVIPWRGADLQELTATVVPWLRERGLPFYHGGHIRNHPSDATTVLGYENVVTADGTDITTYPSLWDPIGIALNPLELSSFGHAKSWIKSLEAMARGIPFIASNHPEYVALGAGRIARRPWQWVQHLEELQDPVVAAAEGAANRRRAEELSISENWSKWADVFEEAISLVNAKGAVKAHG